MKEITDQELEAAMKESRLCRAMTRDGDPCKVWRSTRFCPTTGRWRCRNHGGVTINVGRPRKKAHDTIRVNTGLTPETARTTLENGWDRPV